MVTAFFSFIPVLISPSRAALPFEPPEEAEGGGGAGGAGGGACGAGGGPPGLVGGGGAGGGGIPTGGPPGGGGEGSLDPPLCSMDRESVRSILAEEVVLSNFFL